MERRECEEAEDIWDEMSDVDALFEVDPGVRNASSPA